MIGNFDTIGFIHMIIARSKIKIIIEDQSKEFKWFKKLPLSLKKIISWLEEKSFIKI
jgi:hypothetical protein